jgi:hypothetical protein
LPINNFSNFTRSISGYLKKLWLFSFVVIEKKIDFYNRCWYCVIEDAKSLKNYFFATIFTNKTTFSLRIKLLFRYKMFFFATYFLFCSFFITFAKKF